MKLSNLLLPLGLLAMVSGISSADVTYDATAGTGGFADANTDYAASGGSNAVVSADIELALTVPVKAAITIADENKNVSSNPLFSGLKPTTATTDTLEYNRSKTTYGISSQFFTTAGLLFSSATTNSTLKVTTTPLTHIVDSSAIVDFYPHNSSATYAGSTYKNKVYLYAKNIGDGTSGGTANYAGQVSIPPTTFGTDNIAEFFTRAYFNATQLESLDRIGEFVAVQTVELTCP